MAGSPVAAHRADVLVLGGGLAGVACALAAQAIADEVAPRAIRNTPQRLEELQRSLSTLGVMMRWPEFVHMQATHAMAKSAGELTYLAHGPNPVPLKKH